jgi:hypothetical protein
MLVPDLIREGGFIRVPLRMKTGWLPLLKPRQYSVFKVTASNCVGFVLIPLSRGGFIRVPFANEDGVVAPVLNQRQYSVFKVTASNCVGFVLIPLSRGGSIRVPLRMKTGWLPSAQTTVILCIYSTASELSRCGSNSPLEGVASFVFLLRMKTGWLLLLKRRQYSVFKVTASNCVRAVLIPLSRGGFIRVPFANEDGVVASRFNLFISAMKT